MLFKVLLALSGKCHSRRCLERRVLDSTSSKLMLLSSYCCCIGRGYNFTGKLAVVTGGDSGLGYATAFALAKRGAKAAVEWSCEVQVRQLRTLCRSSSATTMKPEEGLLQRIFPRQLEPLLSLACIGNEKFQRFQVGVCLHCASGTGMGPF